MKLGIWRGNTFFSTRFRLRGSLTTKIFVVDGILPCLVGFFGVLFLFFLHDLIDNTKHGPLVRYKHIPVHHHGIQERDSQQEKLLIGGGATKVPNNKTDDDADKQGALWSWPDLEAKPSSTSVVWVVTPTYKNPYQYAELTRLAQALYPARKLVQWLIVDDYERSEMNKHHVRNLKLFLKQFRINFTLIQTPKRSKEQNYPTIYNKRKRVEGRKAALQFIRKMQLRGIVYFADDQKTYDSDVFREMQDTKKVSMWPTGAITEWLVTSPIINTKGKVVDFFESSSMDFAFNSSLLFKKEGTKANVPWVKGFEGTMFLTSLNVGKEEFQPLSVNATEVVPEMEIHSFRIN